MSARREHGFTLIEFLVVLAIVGGIVSLLASTVNLNRKVINSILLENKHLDELALANDLLSSALSQIVAGKGLIGNGFSVRLWTSGPRSLAHAESLETIFRTNESGRGLMVQWFEQDGEPLLERRLLSESFVVSFLYFGRNKNWSSSWNQEHGLPRLLEVRIKDDRGSLFSPKYSFSYLVRSINAEVCAHGNAKFYCPYAQ